jgi:hypothetical protein
LEALEFNILYPQRSCYQRMLHWANVYYEDAYELDGFVVDDEEEESTGSPLASSDDEGVANILRSLSAALVVSHEGGGGGEACLFVDSDEDGAN